MDLMEGLIRDLFAKVVEVALPDPFPRMTYAEAMRRYGSDKPDLRVPLELVDVADLVAGCDFKVFAGPAADPERPRGRAARARRRRVQPQRDRCLHGLRRRATARRAWPTSRSTTRRRAAKACSRPS